MPEEEVKDPSDKPEAPEKEAKKTLPLDDDFEDEAGFDVDEWIGDDDWEEIEEDEEEELDVPQLVDNGNGTISDSKSSLMWHKSDSFAEFSYGITWFEANDYIEELNEKNSPDSMTGGWLVLMRLYSCLHLQCPTGTRTMRKSISTPYSCLAVDTIPGRMKKSRTISNTP